MKAIMYHYVRPESDVLPYFRYLSLENFEKQLDFFGSRYGFVQPNEFAACIAGERESDGVVLTFDDGVIDHHDYVLPVLRERGLWGIFYIPTSPQEMNSLLHVHAVHQLIGYHGGVAVLEPLLALVRGEHISDEKRNDFESVTYQDQDNDAATTSVKRILNYFIDGDHKESVVDTLTQELLPRDLRDSEAFYMQPRQLQTLAESGMLLGSHSVTHRVMSQLSIAEQAEEIRSSFRTLSRIAGDQRPKSFCYPYGGFHTFTDETERLLGEEGCAFSFNVESRDVSREDVVNRPQALPRFDCNQFPYGSAHLGGTAT